MTTLIVAGLAAVFLGACLAYALMDARARGRSEALTDVVKQNEKVVRRASEILAEHRTRDDASKQLRTGRF
jgi:hypothetical protein